MLFIKLLSCSTMNFFRNINYGDWVLKASFMHIHAPVDKYFVVFETEQEEVANFEMIKQFDHWIVTHPAPDWIISIQNQLSVIINNTILN